MQSRSKASDTGSGLPLYPGGRWRPGPVRFGATAPESLVITMPDGVRLDARISWPADPATGSRTPGLFPVVAELTPYTHTGLAPVGPLSFFPEHGYGHLVVNVRGSGASEGDIQYLSPLDGEDGVAIVDFAAKQLPGSDGRLALIGCSYPAGVALTTAAHLPAGSPVKVIVASCNGFHSQNRGSFLRSGIDTGNVEAMEGLLPRMMGNSASSRSFFTSLATEIKAGGPAAYDGEFWRERLHTGLATRIVASRIPILLWSGWRDHVEGAIRTFTALQNAFCGRPLGGAMEEGQEVSPLYQLLMTDGAHTEGLDLGLYLQWIETWLKNCDTGLQDTATPMHLFEVGSGRWVNLERFPATDLATCWALSPDGTLTRDAVPEADLTLVRDASDALLRFETPPFEHGATLAGPISASLQASSSNSNLQIVATLLDVAADGAAVEITTGTVLGSMRALDESMTWRDQAGTATWPWPKLDRDEDLVPGELYAFDIAMLSRLWAVKPGHRLRLELRGQPSTAQCERGPQPWPRTRGMYTCVLNARQLHSVPGGVYRIRVGGGRGTTLNLPQLPYEAFPYARQSALPTGYSSGERRLAASEWPLPIDW